MRVQVRNLHRRFGKTCAVNGISFELDSGQVFGFIGPNGAGKTTTMRIMSTLDDPSEGDVFIDGLSVTQEPEETRRIVGYMPDTLPAHRDINVHDYLDFFARAYGLRGRRRTQVIEEVEEFTNLLGIREKVLKALSKGMKQRVSLARALIHDPSLLILDEPAAGLDPRARIELRELLRVLAKRGKAILISSHILSELAEICSGAIIIEHGNIVAAGTIDQLLAGHGLLRPPTTNIRNGSPAPGGSDGTAAVGLAGDGRAVEAMRTERSVIYIQAIGAGEGLLKTVLEMPRVVTAEPYEDSGVRVEVEGGLESGADLLAALMERGLRIAEFRRHQVRLEDIFMSVTRGEVS